MTRLTDCFKTVLKKFYVNILQLNKNKMSDKEGYLYCLYNNLYKQYGDNVYKLGRTTNLKNRMNNYTTPFIEKSKYLLTSRKFNNCIQAEKVLFYILRKHRLALNREFFKVELEEVKRVIQQIEEFKDDILERIYNRIINNTCTDKFITEIQQDPDYYKNYVKEKVTIDNMLDKFMYKKSSSDIKAIVIKIDKDDIEYDIETIN